MSSRRYQSQLFNFVSQQTQKLADKTATVLRHIKVTVIWGTQIALYPVYVLFQTTRLVGRQFGQTVQKTLLKLGRSNAQTSDAVLAIDAPIQAVLGAVKQAVITGGDLPEPESMSGFAIVRQWLLPTSQSSGLIPARRSPLAVIRDWFYPTSQSSEEIIPINPYRIQGIASLVDTHHLVLILEENVILDSLTVEQQQQIQQRIILELASFWRRRRQLEAQQTPLSLPVDREVYLPPVRLFRQLMAWIQTSPLALRANLFQEDAIVLEPTLDLDWFAPNVPLAAWNPRNITPPSLPTSKELKKWFGLVPNWSDLETIVWAAVHYFFGDRRQQLSPAQAALPQGEPWLDSTDVFGYSLGFQPDSPQMQGRAAAKRIAATETREIPVLAASIDGASTNTPWWSVATALPEGQTIQFGESVRRFIDRFFATFSTAVVKVDAETTDLEKPVPPQATNLVISTPDVLQETEPFSQIESPWVDPMADWIETPATHVEYVKTPWQKFVAWLDRGVSWIEQKLIALWRWLTRQNP